MHNSSEMNAILEAAVTSMQSLPAAIQKHWWANKNANYGKSHSIPLMKNLQSRNHAILHKLETRKLLHFGKQRAQENKVRD